MGLAVVYGIMERHGGHVEVTSTPGEGTTFTLRFRCVAPQMERPGQASPAAAPARLRVLLIDDEETVRVTLSSLLHAVGHTVFEAGGGIEGLACVADQPLDLVITDLGMPGMTGWEVAQQIKATHPTLPVILLTGWGQQATEALVGQGEVDQVLNKPIRLAELQAAIAQAMSRRAD